jgi:hypothetical protein
MDVVAVAGVVLGGLGSVGAVLAWAEARKANRIANEALGPEFAFKVDRPAGGLGTLSQTTFRLRNTGRRRVTGLELLTPEDARPPGHGHWSPKLRRTTGELEPQESVLFDMGVLSPVTGEWRYLVPSAVRVRINETDRVFNVDLN